MAKRQTPAVRAKLAELLSKNTPVCEALKEAGYSEKTAVKGWAAVPDSVLALMPQQGKALVELGKIDKDARRNLVRGRLITNVIEGKDGGSMSAKILGSESELNMWTPDTQVGLIVLNAPQAVLDNKAALLGEE